jgi:hypothetical protein
VKILCSSRRTAPARGREGRSRGRVLDVQGDVDGQSFPVFPCPYVSPPRHRAPRLPRLPARRRSRSRPEPRRARTAPRGCARPGHAGGGGGRGRRRARPARSRWSSGPREGSSPWCGSARAALGRCPVLDALQRERVGSTYSFSAPTWTSGNANVWGTTIGGTGGLRSRRVAHLGCDRRVVGNVQQHARFRDDGGPARDAMTAGK